MGASKTASIAALALSRQILQGVVGPDRSFLSKITQVSRRVLRIMSLWKQLFQILDLNDSTQPICKSSTLVAALAWLGCVLRIPKLPVIVSLMGLICLLGCSPLHEGEGCIKIWGYPDKGSCSSAIVRRTCESDQESWVHRCNRTRRSIGERGVTTQMSCQAEPNGSIR